MFPVISSKTLSIVNNLLVNDTQVDYMLHLVNIILSDTKTPKHIPVTYPGIDVFLCLKNHFSGNKRIIKGANWKKQN